MKKFYLFAALAFSLQACLSPLAWYDTQLPDLPLGSQPAPSITEQLPKNFYVATNIEGSLDDDYSHLWLGKSSTFVLQNHHDSISISINGGQIQATRDPQRFLLTPINPQILTEVILKDKYSDDIRVYTYSCKPLPLPSIYLAGFKNETHLSLNQIDSLDKLALNFPIEPDGRCLLGTFTLEIRPMEGKTQILTHDAGTLSKAMKKALKAAKAGDLILIHSLSINCGQNPELLPDVRSYWLR